jgi:hypothetical protein
MMLKIKQNKMKDLFVPYEVALRMKELGFDEPCFAFYQIEYNEVSPIMVDDDEQYGLTGYRTCENSEIPNHYISAPIYQQAFSFLIPLQDEFKVCLDENGWYIYNLEGQTYSSNALEKLLSTVELNKLI